MPEQVPSRIGRYRIVGVVGQWTAYPWVMGGLYQGCDDTLGRDVWIKTLAPTAVDPASGCPFVLSVAQARAPFEREESTVERGRQLVARLPAVGARVFPTYILGELGIRHEDTVVVTDNGCENLAPKWSGTPEEPAVCEIG